MDKNKKLDELVKLLKEAGFSASDFADYWTKSEKLQADEGIYPGMYIYADGTVSSKCRKDAKDKIRAVVGAVDVGAKKVIAICLHQYSCSLDDALDVHKFCKICNMPPEKTFLPSEAEMWQILRNAPAINEALGELAYSATGSCGIDVYEKNGVATLSDMGLPLRGSCNSTRVPKVRLGNIWFHQMLSNSYYWTSTEAEEKGFGVAIDRRSGKRVLLKPNELSHVRLCISYEYEEKAVDLWW